MRFKLLALAAFAVASLISGGCPSTGGTGGGGGDTGNLPTGDPTPATQTQLSITSTASVLQANAAGLSTTRFQTSADLSAVFSNLAGSAADLTINWTIETTSPGGPVLKFASTGSTTATGVNVTVQPTIAPLADVSHTVRAETVVNGVALTAAIRIDVVPDPVIGGESTSLVVAPFAIPTVGVDIVGGTRQITLNAGDSGPVGRIAYLWTAIDALPSGVLPANLTTPTITLTIPAGLTGVFAFRVQVTDALDNRSNGIVRVYIGVTDLILDVQVNRIQTEPFGDVTLRTTRVGGIADLDSGTNDTFSYSVRVLDDAGAATVATIAPGAAVINDSNTIDWTVSGLAAEGSYTVEFTVVDRVGQSTVASIPLIYSGDLGLALAPARGQVGVNSPIGLRAVRSGGEPDWTYTFSAVNSAGTTVATAINPPAGTANANVTTNWTLTSGFATPDTYRLFLTVTDGAGKTATGATSVVVGNFLTLDARAANNLLPPVIGAATPANQSAITFTPNGGVAPYTYRFALGSAGGSGTPTYSAAQNTSLPSDPDGTLTVTFTSPLSAAGVEGTYRTDVTVTDALGNTAIDSVVIEVRSLGGGNFNVDVQPAQVQIAPTAGATLYDKLIRTFRTGGVGTISNTDYVWTVRDSAGAAVGGFTIAADAAGSGQTLDWDVTVPAGLAAGTYRFYSTATDDATNSTTGSASILIADILTVDLWTETNVVAPGVPIVIHARANGGSGTRSFAFDGFDPRGLNSDAFGGVFGAFNAGAGTIVYVPPTAGSGTYRIQLDVTDTILNTTVRQTIPVFVTGDTSIIAGDGMINCPAAQLDLSSATGAFLNGTDFFSGLAADTVNIVPIASNQAPASLQGRSRSLTFRIVDNDGNGSLNVSDVTFVGTNQRGEVISESIDPDDTGFNAGATITTLTAPFRSLERISVTYTGAAAGDSIEVGFGEWFGVQAAFPTPSTDEARRAFQVLAFYSDLTNVGENVTSYLDPQSASFDVNFAVPDRQSIRFPLAANTPDGTRDYIVQYESLASISLDIESDDLSLDTSAGDVAVLELTPHGGIPPYDYAITDLGTRGDTNNTTGAVITPSTVTDNFGGVIATYTGPLVTSTEVHTVRATVTDAVGNVAVTTIRIELVP